MDIATGIEEPKLRKRVGESNRGQQVWVAWSFATKAEKAYTVEQNRLEPRNRRTGVARARQGDLPTAVAAAQSISAREITELERIVYEAVLRTGKRGLTWDEAARVTGVRHGSISPRWISLRLQKRIAFALEE